MGVHIQSVNGQIVGCKIQTLENLFERQMSGAGSGQLSLHLGSRVQADLLAVTVDDNVLEHGCGFSLLDRSKRCAGKRAYLR